MLILFFFAWSKKKQKNHYLKIKSAKTTSKRRSTARAVLTASSTRGALPFRFFVVFYVFNLMAGLRIVKHRSLHLLKQCVTPIWRITHHELLFTNFVILTEEESLRVAHTSTFYFSRLLSFSCIFFSFFLIKKETKKSLPENQKRQNYLKAPLHSPSRSPYRLNSRTAAALLFCCFLCFLFKGEFANCEA